MEPSTVQSAEKALWTFPRVTRISYHAGEQHPLPVKAQNFLRQSQRGVGEIGQGGCSGRGDAEGKDPRWLGAQREGPRAQESAVSRCPVTPRHQPARPPDLGCAALDLKSAEDLGGPEAPYLLCEGLPPNTFSLAG